MPPAGPASDADSDVEMAEATGPFVGEKLLRFVDDEYPILGTVKAYFPKKKQGDVDPHVGRVVLSHDGSSMQVLGGGLEHKRRGIDCQHAG